jgi:hypothetical protein
MKEQELASSSFRQRARGNRARASRAGDEFQGNNRKENGMARWGVLLCLVVAGAGALPALAEPYWVTWEGTDYPENEGWERRVNGVGPAIRTLHDGIMTMDGLADLQIDDYYRMERQLNPEAGEEFVMQWRLRVVGVDGFPPAYDPGAAVWSDDDWTVSLLFGTDFIHSFHEAWYFPIEPMVFHALEFRSSDMRSYDLYLDGLLIHVGPFWEPTFDRSRVHWGDRARGSASLTDWDYFRFGIVPEPNSGLLLLALLGSTRALQQSRRMTWSAFQPSWRS